MFCNKATCNIIKLCWRVEEQSPRTLHTTTRNEARHVSQDDGKALGCEGDEQACVPLSAFSLVSKARPRCPNSTCPRMALQPSLCSSREARLSPLECRGHCRTLTALQSPTAEHKHFICLEDEGTKAAFIARLSVKLLQNLRPASAPLYRTARSTHAISDHNGSITNADTTSAFDAL